MNRAVVSNGIVMQPADGLEHLDAAQIAKLIGIGVRTFWRLLAAEKFPAADLKIGTKIVRWRRSTVESWLEAQSN